MNKEPILLPAFIIADLYKNHLIEPKIETDNKLDNGTILKEIEKKEKHTRNNIGHSKQKNISLKFLGENKKRTIVVVCEPNATFINEDELAILTRILSACNLNLADIAILNINNQPITFQQIEADLNADNILLFGVEPATIMLPFNVPYFQLQVFSSCNILSSPGLSHFLQQNNEGTLLKRQLWTGLQKAFNLT